MFNLAYRIDDRFEFEGKIYHVDLSFDNVLRLFEMFEDDLYFEIEKIELALKILIKEYYRIKNKSIFEKIEIYKFIMKEFLDIDTEKEEAPQKRVMDFKKDAGLIYASFMNAYGIDLFEKQGKLHWYKFSNLLAHLPDKTAFKEVVSYRIMKVPSGKHVDPEYRKHVLKMKRVYSLDNYNETPEGKAENLDKQLSIIAKAMLANKK